MLPEGVKRPLFTISLETLKRIEQLLREMEE